jgi:hypothetical protein
MGAESRTGKTRVKRKDVPNDARIRAKDPTSAKGMKTHEQKLTHTKKKKKDYKEQGVFGVVNPNNPLLKVKVNPSEKKIKAIAKKLRQIELLEGKDEAELDEAQRKKIACREGLIAELADLMGVDQQSWDEYKKTRGR